MLHRLIAQGEHQQQDFKFEISDVCKIARTLSAFANTDGGRLLIGVKDNGKIVGVRSDEEIYMVDAAAKLYCTPPVEYRISTHTTEGHTVVIAEVSPTKVHPVRAHVADKTKKAFVRIADENIVASPVQMELWRSESETRGSLLPFTERERELLKLLDTDTPISLNQFSRRGHLQRHRAISLLAQFIRFGLVEQLFVGHKFLYTSSL